MRTQLIRYALLSVILVALPNAVHSVTEVENLISQAGNATDEVARYRFLEQLSEITDLEPTLRADLGKLLPIVDRWANGRAKHLNGELTPGRGGGYLASGLFAWLRNKETATEIDADSPLYPIWGIYRGRALIQAVVQIGRLTRSPEARKPYFDEARRLLKIAREAFPENRVIRMYLDEPIPWPALNPRDPSAPEWANLQRESLEKLADIITFWVEQRQVPDGQFGGGWGDDVEQWRQWATVLIGFEDPNVNASQERLSNGLFALDRMAKGYTNRVSDVEHTGEDSGDAGTAMMHIDPDNPIWQERALTIGRLMETLWTARNDRGQLQFKSTYFSSEVVDTSLHRACDTIYHPRAVQPTLLYWQRTQDPGLTKLFGAWMDTWVDAAARGDRGKPVGVVPSAIHFPEGDIGGVGENWWLPEIKGEVFRWPSHMRMMTSTLLLTSHVTGDRKYLAPIESMAEIRADYLANPVDDPAPGSRAWCGKNVEGLTDALGKYRIMTGDARYDDLLLADASGYVKFRLTGDRKQVTQGLDRTARGFGYDREAYCEEVRWTDRVFGYHRRYPAHYQDPKLPRPNLGLLYSSVTGDFGNPMYFPMNAVRWKTLPRDIAVLVTDHGTSHLSAELYHFGDSPREMGADLYLLDPGDYDLIVQTEGETNRRRFKAEGARSTVSFSLPPGQLATLKIVAASE
jgi:hypothetical protein